MKIKVQNTIHGLIPLYDEDYDEKKKLKLGATYEITVKLARNLQFHRKYFKLLSLAWEYQNEITTERFFNNDFEKFRKTVEIAAGVCDTIYSIDRKEFIDIPKSISFDKMDEIEFRNVYEKVKNVLYSIFLKRISIEEFEKQLINF